ncbi:MAG: anthranilate phosphoribosyltransferase [Verrucomicrobiota bacterium]|nr:anthranilate phosphoribosyltransferase [Verrucomicrobiota bacterium]
MAQLGAHAMSVRPFAHLSDKVRSGFDLTPGEVQEAVALLLAEPVAAEAKADFLAALHGKGESAHEIASFARFLLERAVDLEIESETVIDVCGTGGDGVDLFNVSTAVMFILAAAGATVVKHGNRAVTSRSGSADVLEALGIATTLEPDALRDCIAQHHCGFVYARLYHPAFRALAEMREQLVRKNQRTVFNILGPLLNPARPARQLIGVYAPALTMMFAEVLRELGRERAWVVNGMIDNTMSIDDVSTLGPTQVGELENGRVSSAVLDTQWLGLARPTLAEITGGNAKENAETIVRILDGSDKGAKRALLVANAAAAFVVSGLANEMNSGIARAQEEIDSGRALAKLRALQDYGAE